ncbi:MAG: tRNA lysidine(34) synthetase TilS [Acidobacteriota bacterium]
MSGTKVRREAAYPARRNVPPRKMPRNLGDTALTARVRRYIAQHRLAERGTRVLVALSGGSDSVALAHIVRDLDAAGELRAVGLTHFNHQLRDAAGRDEQFSAQLAESFGWPIVVEREDVAARARRERRSLEDAARTARYEGFDRARATLGADVVALGHTRDDQAETFLLRLIRGAGPRGLAGIHPRHGSIVRPLLCCRRRELRQFLAAREIGHVEDETNADVKIPRNRVRAELLPMLERRFNPSVVDVLADEAELARAMWLWMEESLASFGERLKSEVSPAPEADSRPETSDLGRDLALDVPGLMSTPLALRRLVVWRAMRELAGRQPVSFVHVEAVLDLLTSDAPRSLDMPGHSVHRLGPRLVLTRRRAADRPRLLDPGANFFEYPLSIPGEVAVPEAHCVVTAASLPPGTLNPEALRASSGAARARSGMASSGMASSGMAIVRGDLCTGLWRVRNRRPGDRFRPFGLNGHKKLQNFFVDRKVPRLCRDTVPLVVDENDRIVWVAGFEIDDAFRVNDPAQAVIMLELKLLGGSA